jgi:hypothetical protein
MPYVACSHCTVRVYTLPGMAGRDACPVCDTPLPASAAGLGEVRRNAAGDAGPTGEASAGERAA